MILGDTIAALASSPGHAPRAIVRLSGPATSAALSSLIADPPTGRGCTVERIFLSELPSSIPCVLLRYIAPASYAGEDGAELLVPGGAHIAGLVLETVLSIEGVRRASPGEFSVRALLAGRLDPEQAESVGALVAARTESELAAAHRVLSGEAGSVYRELIGSLVHALALVEAGIDFADHEDVVAISPEDIRARLDDTKQRIGALVSKSSSREAADGSGWAGGGAMVVIAGPPNAGKSTLLNRLAGWERAIVSDVPGTTRDVIAAEVDLHPGRVRVRLADTAGIDASLTTSSAAEAGAQRQTIDAVQRAGVVVWCDPAGVFESAPSHAIRVRTKADLPHARDPDSVIDVCALDGRGITDLEHAIADRALATPPSGEWGVLPRHHDALQTARECVADAISCAEEPELAAQCMRSALDAIGSIVGDVTPDDIIGRIQSTFCVGK